MLVKKINEEIMSPEGKPISEERASLHRVVNICKACKSLDEAIDIFEKEKDKGEKTTIKTMIERAILFQVPNKKDVNSDFVMKRYDLWKKIKNSNGELELTAEEITSIKDNLAKMTNAGVSIVVAGQVMEILEGEK